MTPVHVSQLRGRFRTGSGAALTAQRRGPNGPTKVTPRLVAPCPRAFRAGGDSYQTIAREFGGISHDTVWRMLHEVAMVQPDLQTLVGEEAQVFAGASQAGPVGVSALILSRNAAMSKT